MATLVFPIGALLLGTALLLLGSGLLNTLLALRGSIEGYSDQMLGLIMSAYFIGFFVGTYTALPMIRRVGHIRAFACCAALFCSFALLHALFVNAGTWFVLRLMTGVVLVTLYTIIESWLNGQATSTQRGQVFAIYMIVNLSALALAQPLLLISSASDFTLFIVAAIFICLSLVPIAWTRMAQPEVQEIQRMRIKKIRTFAPVSIAAAAFSGLAMGAFWGLNPVFAERIGLSRQMISAFIGISILGGVLLQYPLGRYSDKHDRRIVLMYSSAAAGVMALFMLLVSYSGYWILIAGLLYGSMSFAIYPIAVAHLMDQLDNNDILAGSSALLLVYGVASAIGPALVGQLMGVFGPLALPLFFALTHGLLVIYILFRLNVRHTIEAEHPSPFVGMVRTTPQAFELLPEEEDEAQEEAGEEAGTEEAGTEEAPVPNPAAN